MILGFSQNLRCFRIQCELHFIPTISFESSLVYLLYVTLCYIISYYILHYVLY